jgi:hypothetical protein
VLDDEGALPLPLARVERVPRLSFLSEKGKSFFLTSYIYLPEDDGGICVDDWHACDPFGLGSSPFFRHLINVQMPEDSLLSDRVRDFLGDEQEAIDASQKLLMDAVVKRLGRVPAFSEIGAPLVDMERAWREAEEDVYRTSRLGTVAVKAGIVLERLFTLLLQEYPCESAWRLFDVPSRKQRVDYLKAIAQQLGYDVSLPSPLCSVRPAGVRRAAQLDRATLIEGAVAALLAAWEHSQHPLREASLEAADLFETICSVAEVRNRGAHDSVEGPLDIKLVAEQVEAAYNIVRLLARSTNSNE